MILGERVSAVVTGGASGLGEGTARALAARGVKVAILDRDAERGRSVAGDIGGIAVEVDVTDADGVARALEQARAAHGQERITVNCAGIAWGAFTVQRERGTGLVRAHDPDDFARVISINLIGTFFVASRSAAGMVTTDPVTEDGGRGVIIMTASVAGADGQIGQAAYGASKAGVMGLTLPMARDLARDGIRVVSIMPGLFETPMFDKLPEKVQQRLNATTVFPGRLGRPDDYAALALHICENEMLNGACIRLDGAVRLPPA